MILTYEMAYYNFPFAHCDDELIECVYDSHDFPLSVINELKYDPFSECEVLDTIDNFLVNNVPNIKCEYHFCSEYKVSSPQHIH